VRALCVQDTYIFLPLVQPWNQQLFLFFFCFLFFFFLISTYSISLDPLTSSSTLIPPRRTHARTSLSYPHRPLHKPLQATSLLFHTTITSIHPSFPSVHHNANTNEGEQGQHHHTSVPKRRMERPHRPRQLP
jgi:hypothetical protein